MIKIKYSIEVFLKALYVTHRKGLICLFMLLRFQRIDFSVSLGKDPDPEPKISGYKQICLYE